MKRNPTIDNLNNLTDLNAEWIKNPISLGSIYVKPTENKQSFSDKIYSYLYYFCCCRYIDYV
jgi:hypothetical protein